MKYLFIVQGEGRGHLTQALALSDILRNAGHEIAEVLVGTGPRRKIPGFFHERIGAPVRTYPSPNFSSRPNEKKTDLARSVLDNLSLPRLRRFGRSIELLHRRIRSVRPDAVVNFYELLAGLTNLRFREETPFFNIGHQFLVRHPDYRFGHGPEQGKFLLRLSALLCGLGAVKTLALSFYPMRDVPRERLAVVPPLLRPEIAGLQSAGNGYLLGYLLNAGYAEEIRVWHRRHPDTVLHIFWDKADEPQEVKAGANLTFHRLDDRKFLELMAGCSGYVTTAGFESVCEAMYLDKPVMMIPVHAEQEINAADAAAAGAGIVSGSFDLDRMSRYMQACRPEHSDFRKWADSARETFVRHLTALS